MEVTYDKFKKVWHTPNCISIKYGGLGKAILDKLSNDDPQRVLEYHYETGDQLTVEEVRLQTITVAKNLRRLGVGDTDVVVVYSMVNKWITPIAFGCFAIGAPVNFFETNFNEEDARITLEELDPTVIIYEEEYELQLNAALSCTTLPKLRHILSLGPIRSPSVQEVLFKPIDEAEADFQPFDIEDPAAHPASLTLTSGSTGRPKIIQLSHAMLQQGVNSWWSVQPNSRIFCFSPLRWISQLLFMLQEVFLGAQRIYTSQSPSGALGKDIIDACKVTHFFTVPAVYLGVLLAAEQSKDSSSLSSLRTALIGGEVVDRSLVEFTARIAPRCKIVRAYGMSELSGCISSDEFISDCDVNGGALKNFLMAKIIDGSGRALGPNERGHLCIKSAVPYLGYYKNEAANRQSFLEDGWFDTGDYAFMDSHNLLNIVARYKSLVRSGNVIIVPKDVENIVSNHPEVLVAAFVGHPDPENQSNQIGTVFVVLRKRDRESNRTQADLEEYVREKLTPVQLPIVRYFRVISEMPLTSCGKVDRTALSDKANESIK